MLSVASLPSTIGEIVGFTLAHDTCEQGYFTIYTLTDSVGIGNLVTAENRVFQRKAAISALIMGSAQMPLYARGMQGVGSTSAWGEVGSKSISIRVRAASPRNIINTQWFTTLSTYLTGVAAVGARDYMRDTTTCKKEHQSMPDLKLKMQIDALESDKSKLEKEISHQN